MVEMTNDDKARVAAYLDTAKRLGFETMELRTDVVEALLSPPAGGPGGWKLADDGPPVMLGECRPGLFRLGEHVGLKTEYRMILGKDVGGGKVEFNMSDWPDAYVVSSGEVWWGGTNKHHDRAELVVQPCELERSPSPPAPGGWRPSREEIVETIRKRMPVPRRLRDDGQGFEEGAIEETADAIRALSPEPSAEPDEGALEMAFDLMWHAYLATPPKGEVSAKPRAMRAALLSLKDTNHGR